ncbi:MAG: hypothetical protein AAGD00_00560 [Planctomycetota bacterium]
MPTPRTPRRRIRRVATRLALALAYLIVAIAVRHTAHAPIDDESPVGLAHIRVADETLVSIAQGIVRDLKYQLLRNRPRDLFHSPGSRVIVIERDEVDGYAGRWAHRSEAVMRGAETSFLHDIDTYNGDVVAVYEQSVRVTYRGIAVPALRHVSREVDQRDIDPEVDQVAIAGFDLEARRVLREVPIKTYDEWYPDRKPPAVEVSRVARENALLATRSGWIFRNIPFELACTGLLLASLWFTIGAGRIALRRMGDQAS